MNYYVNPSSTCVLIIISISAIHNKPNAMTSYVCTRAAMTFLSSLRHPKVICACDDNEYIYIRACHVDRRVGVQTISRSG